MAKGGSYIVINGHCRVNIRPENSPANYVLQKHWEDTFISEGSNNLAERLDSGYLFWDMDDNIKCYYRPDCLSSFKVA